jgi:hypothetical protein
MVYALNKTNKAAARLDFDWETAINYFPVGIEVKGIKMDRIVKVTNLQKFLNSLIKNNYQII